MQSTGQLEACEICSYTLQASFCVECASWLLYIPFWLEANYIFLRTSHFFSLSSSSLLPHQQIFTTKTFQQGTSGSESSRTTLASFNMPPARTQLQYRHHFVHCGTANTAIDNMTLDKQYTLVHTTRSNKNKEQHDIGCQFIHSEADSRKLSIYYTAGVRRQLRNQFIAACNGEYLWLTKGFASTVHKIEHLDVVSSGLFADIVNDQHPREWREEALTTLEEATQIYMVEVIAKSHLWMQQLISGRFSAFLQLWQDKEVGYSEKSLTSALPWIWPKWSKEGFHTKQ